MLAQNTSTTFFSRVVTFTVVLSPLFLPYGYHGINFALILELAIIIWSVLGRKISFNDFKNPYIFFLIHTFIFTNIVCIVQGGHFFAYRGEFIFFVLLCITHKYFNIDYGLKLYRILFYFTCVVFLSQEISSLIFGSRFSALIPNLPLIYEDSYLDMNMSDMIERQLSSDRSSSVFLEPAQFAQFILPYFAIELFRNRNFSISSKVIFFLCIIFLLESGNGIIVSTIILLLWVIEIKKSYKNLFLLNLILLCFIIIIPFLLNSEFVSDLLNRSSEFSSVDTTSSGFLRVIRGYYLWADIPLINEIFGLNFNSLESFYHNLSPYVQSLFAKEFYINTFQSKLIYSGFIGMILYFNWFLQEIRTSTYIGKHILIMALIMHFIASFDPVFLIMYVALAQKSTIK